MRLESNLLLGLLGKRELGISWKKVSGVSRWTTLLKLSEMWIEHACWGCRASKQSRQGGV